MIINYRRYLCFFIALLLFNTACTADELESDNEKMFYFLGTGLSTNLKQLKLSDEEVDIVARGLRDALRGEAIELDAETYGAMLNEVAQERIAAGAVDEMAASVIYVEEMAAEDGAITTESGLVFLELTAGDGDSPSGRSVVKAHYHGTLRDGSIFDSSVQRGQPFTSPLTKVIRCWQEAIPMMKEGGKSKITCPAELAYGTRGNGAVPGGAALTFEIELIEVVN